MRYGPFMIAGLMALAAPALAESRSAYVTMVLQAFAVKVQCPQGNRIWNFPAWLGGICDFERDGFYRVADDSQRGR